MLIVLTGIDGAGKSTAARGLLQSAQAQEGKALVLRNHAGRRWMSLLSARLGVRLPPRAADTAETIIRVSNVLISHARARRFQGLVVMDRHLHCQLALRRAKGIPRGWFLPRLIATLPAPDAIIHLDVDPDLAHRRIVARGTDEESLADLSALQDAYLSLPEYPDFVKIDAGASSAEVLAQVKRAVGVKASLLV